MTTDASAEPEVPASPAAVKSDEPQPAAAVEAVAAEDKPAELEADDETSTSPPEPAADEPEVATAPVSDVEAPEPVPAAEEAVVSDAIAEDVKHDASPTEGTRNEGEGDGEEAEVLVIEELLPARRRHASEDGSGDEREDDEFHDAAEGTEDGAGARICFEAPRLCRWNLRPIAPRRA
jgi:hypothetical protein